MTLQPRFVVAIPARYAATRLPGKPLCPLNGEPLIRHVARRALTVGAEAVWLATDDKRIADAVADLAGLQIAMTSPRHRSGTDRIGECAQIAGWDSQTCVVNVQGDEPFVPPTAVHQLARLLHDSSAPMATLAARIESVDDIFNPNIVKLVRNRHGDVMYFSRAAIPWQRTVFPYARQQSIAKNWLRHIGVYAYRAGFLSQIRRLPSSALEEAESLEQLRVLEAGHRIVVDIATVSFPHGIDTPADLAAAQTKAVSTH